MTNGIIIDPYRRKVDGSFWNRLTRPIGGTNVCKRLEELAAQKKLQAQVRENELYLVGEIGQSLSHSWGYAGRLYAAGVYAFEIPRYSSAAKIKLILDSLADHKLSSARALLARYQIEITTITHDNLSQIPCSVVIVNEGKISKFGKVTYSTTPGSPNEMINPQVIWDLGSPDRQSLTRLAPYLRLVSCTNPRASFVLERTQGNQNVRERYLLIQSTAAFDREFVHELQHRLDFEGQQVFRDKITGSVFDFLLSGLIDTKCERKCIEEGHRELLVRELEPHTRKTPGFLFNLPENDFIWVYGREKSEVVAQLLGRVIPLAFCIDFEILGSIRAICGHLKDIGMVNFNKFEIDLKNLDPSAIKIAVKRNNKGNPSEEPEDLCLSVNNLFAQLSDSRAHLKFDPVNSEFFIFGI